MLIDLGVGVYPCYIIKGTHCGVNYELKSKARSHYCQFRICHRKVHVYPHFSMIVPSLSLQPITKFSDTATSSIFQILFTSLKLWNTCNNLYITNWLGYLSANFTSPSKINFLSLLWSIARASSMCHICQSLVSHNANLSSPKLYESQNPYNYANCKMNIQIYESKSQMKKTFSRRFHF